jgi:hypothetical protein
MTLRPTPRSGAIVPGADDGPVGPRRTVATRFGEADPLRPGVAPRCLPALHRPGYGSPAYTSPAYTSPGYGDVRPRRGQLPDPRRRAGGLLALGVPDHRRQQERGVVQPFRPVTRRAGSLPQMVLASRRRMHRHHPGSEGIAAGHPAGQSDLTAMEQATGSTGPGCRRTLSPGCKTMTLPRACAPVSWRSRD